MINKIRESNIKQFFKVVIPEDLSHQYEILLIKNHNIVEKRKLDIRNNDDAFILWLIFKIDNKSLIEFDGKQYRVKNWNVNYINQTVDIFI